MLLTLTVMIGLLRAGRARLLGAAGGHLLHPVRARARPRQRAGRQGSRRYVAPRWLIIGGGVFVLGAMLYGSTLNRNIPYFPDLFVPIVVGGFGIGVISVILPLCAVAEVGPREIGPVSAITLMVQNLGGPLVLVVIQAVQTSRTLYLGGTTGPVKDMTPAQLDALGCGLHLLAAVGGRHRDAGRHRRVLDRLLRTPDRHARSTPAKPSRPASCRYADAVDDDVRPTRQQISDAVDAAGWRLILGAIHAEVPTRSLLEGSEAASLAVSAVGADGQGHLTVDIRADRTVLRLHSADVGAVTGRDIRLARAVSRRCPGPP